MAAQDRTLQHFAEVSFSPQLKGEQGRKEIKPDLDLARRHKIATVRMSSGFEIPAAIGLRTTFNKVPPSIIGMDDRWRWQVIISPFDEPLLRRLHAKREKRDVAGRVKFDPLEAPLPESVEARFDALEAIRKAHEGLHPLRATEGTYLEITFAIARDLGRVCYWRASSTDALRKQAARALNHNLREGVKYEAAHWPFSGPFVLMGRQVYPWARVVEPDLLDVPVIPDDDPWEGGGAHEEAIDDIVAIEFQPVLESLWKAAFAQDGDGGREGKVAAQLRRQGYPLERLEATRIGVGPLKELMQANRKAGNLTMLGAPDLLDELSDEHVVQFPRRGR